MSATTAYQTDAAIVCAFDFKPDSSILRVKHRRSLRRATCNHTSPRHPVPAKSSMAAFEQVSAPILAGWVLNWHCRKDELVAQRQLKHQRQKLYSNCGPTCVAMLAKTSQADACRAMFGEVRGRNCYSVWSDIRRALKKLGLKFGSRANFVSKWESVPDTAIVACSLNKWGSWHWVVYSPREGLIYDPLRKHPVTIRGTRRKPFSYLTVTPRR